MVYKWNKIQSKNVPSMSTMAIIENIILVLIVILNVYLMPILITYSYQNWGLYWGQRTEFDYALAIPKEILPGSVRISKKCKNMCCFSFSAIYLFYLSLNNLCKNVQKYSSTFLNICLHTVCMLTSWAFCQPILKLEILQSAIEGWLY